MKPKTTRINPPELFNSTQYGFSQMSVVKTATGKQVHLSGQVAWNSQGVIIGPGDLYAQMIQSLKNIEIALGYVDLQLRDVAAIRIYLRDTPDLGHAAVSRALVDMFGDDLPCSTWIVVPSLAREEFLVEIEPAAIVVAD